MKLLVTCTVVWLITTSVFALGEEETCEDILFAEDSRKKTIQHVDCAGADLRDRDLSGLTIINGNFASARLHNADLSGIKIENSTMDRAKFYDAELGGAILAYSTFESASFRDADLLGATIEGGGYFGADFTGADLRGAIIEGRVRFDYANISGADFTDVEFESGANVDGAWFWDHAPPSGLSKGQMANVFSCEFVDGLDPTKKPSDCIQGN